MTKEEIKQRIKEIKKFYYYYNFDGIEVHKKSKNCEHRGLANWSKLSPVLSDVFSKVTNPFVFDIGCNMGLLSHEMTKIGAEVIAVDTNIKAAKFFAQYISENSPEEWKVELKDTDIIKDKIKVDSRVNVITAFAVMYWLEPHADEVVESMKQYFPNHKYFVMQGNLRASKSKVLPLSTVNGMVDILKKHDYRIENIFKWGKFQKPVVIGRYDKI